MNKNNLKIILLLLLVALFVFPIESHALLTAKCASIDYVAFTSEIIVHGKVIKQEAREENKMIYTYTDIQVDKYRKGEGNQIITVKSSGGNIGDKFTWVENMPIFQIGETGYLYLKKGDGGFYNVVCGFGIQNNPPFMYLIIVSIVLLLLIILIVFFIYKKIKKRNNKLQI